MYHTIFLSYDILEKRVRTDDEDVIDDYVFDLFDKLGISEVSLPDTLLWEFMERFETEKNYDLGIVDNELGVEVAGLDNKVFLYYFDHLTDIEAFKKRYPKLVIEMPERIEKLFNGEIYS